MFLAADIQTRKKPLQKPFRHCVFSGLPTHLHPHRGHAWWLAPSRWVYRGKQVPEQASQPLKQENKGKFWSGSLTSPLWSNNTNLPTCLIYESGKLCLKDPYPCPELVWGRRHSSHCPQNAIKQVSFSTSALCVHVQALAVVLCRGSFCEERLGLPATGHRWPQCTAQLSPSAKLVAPQGNHG